MGVRFRHHRFVLPPGMQTHTAFKPHFAAWFCSALLLLGAVPAKSDVFPWLYQGVIDSSGSYPSEDEVRRALSQVITRLTALRQPQEHEQLKRMFDNPYQLVSEYSFLPRTAEGTLPFRIGFQRAELEKHLRLANLPVWNEWRPRLLLFVVSADGASLTRILGEGGGESWRADEYRRLIRDLQYRRGLLLMLPSHSYADRDIAHRKVLTGNYWQAARALKKLYKVEGVILLHFERVGLKRWSTGRYFYAAETEGQMSVLKSHQISEVVEKTIERIGDYYWTLNARHERPTKALRLIVEGLDSYADLLQARELLNAILPGDSGLLLSRLSENRAEFDFSVQQSVLELRRLLSQQKQFVLSRQQTAPGFVQNLFIRFLPGIDQLDAANDE